MARSRKRPSPETARKVSTQEQQTDGNDAIATETRKVAPIMATETLNMDQIAELMSKARTKGAGEQVLQNFLDSGEQGVVVDLNTGPLAGKNANQASATLANAKKRTKTVGDRIEPANPQFAPILIKKAGKGDDARVALINTSLVNLGG